MLSLRRHVGTFPFKPNSESLRRPGPVQPVRFRPLTGGGRTLQIPVFSAMGRILLINAKGSANSSQVGSNTGHSGGGVNSAGPRWVISQVRFRSEAEQKRVAQRKLPEICNTVCTSVIPSVRQTLEQHEQSTHTRTSTLTVT